MNLGGGRSNIISVTVTSDRRELNKAKDSGTMRFLGLSGAYIRKTAQSLLRPSRQTSQAGQPPSSPTKRLKNSVRYSIGQAKNPDAVIGPVLLASINDGVNTLGHPISEILEFGGNILIQTTQKKWRKVAIAARPFMRVALRIAAPKLAGFWRGVIKKG